MFKRLFVLYDLSYFLAPTPNRTTDLRVLKSLQDVERINDYDWCSFMLDKSCEGVTRCQKNINNKHIGGCLVFLQIVFFHRLVFRGKPVASTIPLIQHWDSDKVKERVKEELKSGCYGYGILDTTTYPTRLTNRSGRHVPTVQDDIEKARTGPSSSRSVYRSITDPSLITYQMTCHLMKKSMQWLLMMYMNLCFCLSAMSKLFLMSISRG